MREERARPRTTKNVYFFKSGDQTFPGVRLPVNYRKYRNLDAVLDDLSYRIPGLPRGVRTLSTPQGRDKVTDLNQLRHMGSYICSDLLQARRVPGVNLSKIKGLSDPQLFRSTSSGFYEDYAAEPLKKAPVKKVKKKKKKKKVKRPPVEHAEEVEEQLEERAKSSTGVVSRLAENSLLAMGQNRSLQKMKSTESELEKEEERRKSAEKRSVRDLLLDDYPDGNGWGRTESRRTVREEREREREVEEDGARVHEREEEEEEYEEEEEPEEHERRRRSIGQEEEREREEERELELERKMSARELEKIEQERERQQKELEELAGFDVDEETRGRTGERMLATRQTQRETTGRHSTLAYNETRSGSGSLFESHKQSEEQKDLAPLDGSKLAHVQRRRLASNQVDTDRYTLPSGSSGIRSDENRMSNNVFHSAQNDSVRNVHTVKPADDVGSLRVDELLSLSDEPVTIAPRSESRNERRIPTAGSQSRRLGTATNMHQTAVHEQAKRDLQSRQTDSGVSLIA